MGIFEAKDFDSGIGPADDGKELCTYEWAARKANAKLQKEAESCLMVYGNRDIERSDNPWIFTTVKTGDESHQARLMFIEELPKEPCQHEPVLFRHITELRGCGHGQMHTNYFYDEKSKCKHCGAKLVADWKEVK